MLLKKRRPTSHISFTQKFLLSIALSSLAANAFCATEAEKFDARYSNWYQVELLIFERTQYNGGANPELWPHNLDLRYPEYLEYLFTPEEWENFTNPPLEESLYNDDSELASFNEDALAETALIETNLNDADTSNEAAIETLGMANETQQAPLLPEMEKAFLKLGREHKELNQEAQKLKNRNRYRVLFHESWRQPMLEKQQSPSLVIVGGEQFDTHSELEGTIKISVNRYLHIDTDLWKTHYEVNYGQSPGYWPMPPTIPEPTRPNVDASLNSNDTESLQANHAPTQSGTAFNSNTLYENDTKHADNNMNLDFNSKSSILKNDGFNYYDAINSDLSSENTLFEFNEVNSYEALTKAPYIVKEIIKFDQKRRMRSNELHYIDHPRLGLLIKITPYEVALPEAEPVPATLAPDPTLTP